MKNTIVYDHIGFNYYLSDLTELSKRKIPYPGQFADKPDYEQRSLLQDLQMKDVLSTRTDWINQGRDPSTMNAHQYADGEETFITIDGISLRDPVLRVSGRFRNFFQSQISDLSAGAIQ